MPRPITGIYLVFFYCVCYNISMMKDISKIKDCRRCSLYKNQLPLLDNIKDIDVMWVGLSAKEVNDIDKNIPLENNTNSGRIIEKIENNFDGISFYKTNLVKCLPLDSNKKLRDQNISEECKDLISLIYYNYIADENEKKEILKILKSL